MNMEIITTMNPVGKTDLFLPFFYLLGASFLFAFMGIIFRDRCYSMQRSQETDYYNQVKCEVLRL